MPELPDLQVISRNLDDMFCGKKLHAFTLKYTNCLEGEAEKVTATIVGHKLEKIYRDGKQLRFSFGKGRIMGIHLMLHGALLPFHARNAYPHVLAEWIFDDEAGLALTDFQKLARLTLNPPEADAPDALSSTVTAAFLEERMNGSRATIKKFLTNQQVLRGIGNAYADEILWDARISPFSICDKVPHAAVSTLAESIKKVLTWAEKEIRKTHPDITSGEIRDFLGVHNHHKDKSPTGHPLLVKKSGGSTYYTDEQILYT